METEDLTLPGDLTATERPRTQARGRARRQALLHAARTLLGLRDISSITIPALAEHADIPASSVYHFFPDPRALFIELAREISDEMTQMPLEISTDPNGWPDVVRGFFGAARTFFNADPAARQLVVGDQVSPDIRNAACYDDGRFGHALYATLDGFYILPIMAEPAKVCLNAIAIADTFYGQSVREHGRITDEAFEEAVRAAGAYLGTYIPPILLRREQALPETPPLSRKE